MTSPLRDRLRLRLTEARRARDADLTAALRSAVAAIENAEAVPTGRPGEVRGEAPGGGPGGAVPSAGSEHVAGAALGLGAAEAQRRTLDDEDERGIVRAEVADLRSSARQYADVGATARAESAERVAAELDDLLT